MPKVNKTVESGEQSELWLGLVDGVPVAAAELALPTRDNVTSAQADVRVVPEQRRQGHGTALLTHLLDRARTHGRARVFGEINEPLDEISGEPTPGQGFGRAIGARPVLSEIRRVLDVTAVDDEALTALRADAEKHADGYSVLQWQDRTPEELIDDLAVLMARMSTDAPLE